MRQWALMLVIALSSLIFTACNKGGGSASTPDTCTQNAYGQWVNQNGQPCTPGYNQYNCLGTQYNPGPYGNYMGGQYMGPNGYPMQNGYCNQYVNFQQTFPYNLGGQYMGMGCQGWSMMYPGSVYYPVQVGPNYWVCVKQNSFPWMSGMNYNSMYTCIPGFNCGSQCRMQTTGVGLFPLFWLGGSLGVCY